MKINLTVAIALSIAALGGSPAAQSQTYPAKPVRIIVPFSPGGGTDIVARTVAPKLADRFGQQVVVDNRVGAAGAIGAEITVRSPPDGYTLMVGSTSEIGIGPSLYSKLPYDVLRDLVPVTPLAATPMVLVVHPSMPVRTAKDLVALARARPGQINYGSAGAGSGAHMAAELFRYLTKADIVHVPYKGVAPAMADVIGGQVQVLFTTLPSATAFIKAGRLKALGVASPQRASSMPELATMAESGVPGYEMEYWYGFFAPAATPKDILARIHADTTEVL
ncbi:MAG: tripartite tricarboxylate transporter substrate binding protein, partial [Betaproteobacteria bacterium]|nr:tripartite tricarboxylate transporter substrate binding protein [Betaproteobacteria bacterium]